MSTLNDHAARMAAACLTSGVRCVDENRPLAQQSFREALRWVKPVSDQYPQLHCQIRMWLARVYKLQGRFTLSSWHAARAGRFYWKDGRWVIDYGNILILPTEPENYGLDA